MDAAAAWKPKKGKGVTEEGARELVSALMAMVPQAKTPAEMVKLTNAALKAMRQREPYLERARACRDRWRRKRMGMREGEGRAPKAEPAPSGLEELLEGLEGGKGLDGGAKP